MKVRNFVVLAVSFVSTVSFAASTANTQNQDQASDSSVIYSLTNPMPAEKMQAMTTDRIGKVPSAQTVAAGHFQAEFDAINYAQDSTSMTLPLVGTIEAKQTMMQFAPITLKAGIVQDIDVSVAVQSYNRVTTSVTGAGEKTQSAFGDISTAVKYTLWTEESNNMALAIVPSITWPTNQFDNGASKIDGSITVPFAMSLPMEMNLGVFAAADYNRNTIGAQFVSWNINSGLAVSRSVYSDLGAYVGFSNSQTLLDGAEWQASANAGLTYGLTKDLSIDAGSNFGLTAAAQDLNPYIGAAVRF